METPFVYGKIAVDKNFTDREEETEKLVDNFLSLVNTIIISPRRWGKSSLVAKAAGIAIKRDRNLIFCFIDLFNVRSENQFYQLFAQEVLRASSSKMENLVENARKFAGRFIPRISIGPDSNNEVSISLDWKEVEKHPDDILNLPENIALEKNLKIVVCIDEFQNLSTYSDPVSFQKKLRSHWQKHRLSSYCIYGSKRHMLMDVFSSPSMPFYKFGDILFLQKISEDDWVKYIKTRFRQTGKIIGDEDALQITNLAECHPYYVQQLAQQTWFRTEVDCNNNIVMESHENLMLQLSLLFQKLTEDLSSTQVNFLKALLEEVQQLSAKDTLLNYDLGTSANVLRIKQALREKEIIDINGAEISILDPIYKNWLRKYYFRLI